jgi:hypothetical protein
MTTTIIQLTFRRVERKGTQARAMITIPHCEPKRAGFEKKRCGVCVC